MNQEHVLVLHGLLMYPVTMRYIGHGLEKAGYQVHYQRLATVRSTCAENAQTVYAYIRQLNVSKLHIVAHSLGGLVTMHLLARHADVPPGRVVMLGSPVQGSQLAQRLAAWPLVSRLVKNSLHEALSGEDIPAWPDDREWGMIAGSRAIGQGVLLGGFDGPSDGTVLLEETRHPAQQAHLLMPVTHTQMQLSSAVNRQIVCFLQTGQFESAAHQA